MIIFAVLFSLMILLQLLVNYKIKSKASAFLEEANNRLKVSWVLLAGITVAFCLGHVGITLLFMLISALALREFVSLLNMRGSDYWPLFCSFYVLLPLQYLFVIFDMQFLLYIFLPVYAFLAMPLLSIKDNANFFERAAKFQWAQIACIYCLSYAPAIAGLELRGGSYQSTQLLLYLLIVVFFSDALQYIFGKSFGKKPLAPKISPNKTVEGAVYGTLATVLIAVFIAPITPFTHWQSALMATIMCLVGIAAGLVMSSIKRSMGIKDWGDILGAHGGVLDRFDSLIFTAPLFYHLCKCFYP